jgi:hypothetical protein
MLKLHDGIHLHQKQQNKKIKRGGAKVPRLSILGDGAHLRSKATKKKEEPNCAKTWQWCPLALGNNKTKRKKRES